jgi:hypothetical protein
MIAMEVFIALHTNTPYAQLPSHAHSLLRQCATPELLGWLLESTVTLSCGEHPAQPVMTLAELICIATLLFTEMQARCPQQVHGNCSHEGVIRETRPQLHHG